MITPGNAEGSSEYQSSQNIPMEEKE